MGRPQRLIGRDRDDERAARARDPSQLAQGAPVVGGVLETSRQVTRSNDCVGEGHALDGAEPGRVAAAARRGHRARVRIDADHGAAPAQLVEHPARSAARIEDPGVGGEPDAIELGMQDAPAAPVPPMALVAGEDGVDLAAVHHALAGRDESRYRVPGGTPRSVRPTSVECAIAQRRTGAQGTAARGEQVPRPSSDVAHVAPATRRASSAGLSSGWPPTLVRTSAGRPSRTTSWLVLKTVELATS